MIVLYSDSVVSSMSTRLQSVFVKHFLLALLVAPWLLNSFAFGATTASSSSTSLRILVDTLQPVLSDFDRDNKLDQARLSSSGQFKTILVSFGKSSWTALSFKSHVFEQGSVVSEDIDDDGDIDLVWISPRADELVLWLGDGDGNFSLQKKNFDLDHILSSLTSSGRPSIDVGNDLISAILQAGSFVLPELSGYGSVFPADGASAMFDAGAPHAPSLSVLKLRGPPPRLL